MATKNVRKILIIAAIAVVLVVAACFAVFPLNSQLGIQSPYRVYLQHDSLGFGNGVGLKFAAYDAFEDNLQICLSTSGDLHELQKELEIKLDGETLDSYRVMFDSQHLKSDYLIIILEDVGTDFSSVTVTHNSKTIEINK